MVYYYASNNTMTVTNKEAKQFDEQLEKLKPQRITAQMKRDNTI